MYKLLSWRIDFLTDALVARILSKKRSYIDPYFWQNDHSLFDHTFNHDCKLHYSWSFILAPNPDRKLKRNDTNPNLDLTPSLIWYKPWPFFGGYPSFICNWSLFGTDSAVKWSSSGQNTRTIKSHPIKCYDRKLSVEDHTLSVSWWLMKVISKTFNLS